MKKILKPAHLPALAAILGLLALVLRRMVYMFAMDGRGLLVNGHPLAKALWVLTAAAMTFLAAAVWKLDGSAVYEDNFAASRQAMLGHFAAALGVLSTVLTNEPRMPGYLGTVWLVLGYTAPVCLAWAGVERGRGTMPSFLLHLIPCLFLLIHMINHYQMWSADPQVMDYAFMLFGTMALMLFAFYAAAFEAGMGRRRMHLFMGLGAVYLLLAELATGQYPWLYLGGIAWAMTDLCTFEPKAVPESKKEK